jgi:DNA-binding Xre family transcriptional regulator
MDEEHAKQIGCRLNKIRIQRGFRKIKDLGRKCGWGYAKTHMILIGTHEITTKELTTVCNALSCSADEILRTNKYKEFSDHNVNSPIRMITHNLALMDKVEQRRLAVISQALTHHRLDITVTIKEEI